MQLASSKLHADQKYMESIYEHWQSDSTQDHLTHRKAAEATESFLKIFSYSPDIKSKEFTIVQEKMEHYWHLNLKVARNRVVSAFCRFEVDVGILSS